MLSQTILHRQFRKFKKGDNNAAGLCVKAVDDLGQPIPGIFAELQAERARIGWSYRDDLDLRLIQNNIQQGQPLNQAQQKAKRCLGFLTRVVPNDYLLYPHQPNRGEFCVVQVTGDYNYLTAANSPNGDFRSVRPCSLLTPNPIDMYGPDRPCTIAISPRTTGTVLWAIRLRAVFHIFKCPPSSRTHPR